MQQFTVWQFRKKKTSDQQSISTNYGHIMLFGGHIEIVHSNMSFSPNFLLHSAGYAPVSNAVDLQTFKYQSAI